MRLFEFSKEVLIPVYATERFRKTLKYYVRGYGDKVQQTVLDFIEFKRENPNEQFAPKDTPFTGNPALRGYNHFHIIHGKVVLIYDITKHGLVLYSLVEHSEFDTKKACTALGEFCDAAKYSEFDVETEGGAKNVSLTPEQKEEIAELFYIMAAEMPEALMDALNGNWKETMSMMRAVGDNVTSEIVFKTFGGEDKIKSDIAIVLKNMGVLREAS